jgi:predicted Fe-S protein YdhL (DUF1289 family)
VTRHPSDRAPDEARAGRPLDEVFAALAGSAFRRRFRLREAELAYLRRKGTAAVLRHADEMIAARLAPAQPPNDGKQTPMRGHPVFLAQHATATCCRGCLAKWHGIAKGRALDEGERAYVVSVIARWLDEQERAAPEARAAEGEQLGLGGGLDG